MDPIIRKSRLISIHTPAKGVTRLICKALKITEISIHTPAKGVTEIVKKTVSRDWNFNPHSREGSDIFTGDIETLCSDFNPHSREGSD